jgi:hypothetical protein
MRPRAHAWIRDNAVRAVVTYMLLSLDGVAEQPDEFITEFDQVMDDNLARVIATQDTELLGRAIRAHARPKTLRQGAVDATHARPQHHVPIRVPLAWLRGNPLNR